MPHQGTLAAEKCRAEATRVRREAERMQITALRQQLLRIAYDYEVMAETIETLERQRQEIASERNHQKFSHDISKSRETKDTRGGNFHEPS